MATSDRVHIRLPEKRFALVVWEDANGNATTEYAEGDMPGVHRPAVYHSWGWIVISDERGVSLVNEWCPKDESYRSRMFIPRGMIREEILLDVARQRSPGPKNARRMSRPSGHTTDTASDHSTPQSEVPGTSPTA